MKIQVKDLRTPKLAYTYNNYDLVGICQGITKHELRIFRVYNCNDGQYSASGGNIDILWQSSENGHYGLTITTPPNPDCLKLVNRIYKACKLGNNYFKINLKALVAGLDKIGAKRLEYVSIVNGFIPRKYKHNAGDYIQAKKLIA